MAWCEDCRYLLDLMCSLAPDDRKKTLESGRSYFARKCYRKAGNIKHPIQRWSTYWRIYRFFDYAQSPAFALRTIDYPGLKHSLKSLLK